MTEGWGKRDAYMYLTYWSSRYTDGQLYLLDEGHTLHIKNQET